MSKRKIPSFINMGTSLLLVVFIVICMVMFAVLSISTAKSNLSMSEASAERSTEYYAASNIAEELVRDLYTDMQNGHEISAAMYPELTSVSSENEETIVEFSVPVHERQVLEVTIRLNYSDCSYEIDRWAVSNL